MIIVTVSPRVRAGLLMEMADHPLIQDFRINTGVASHETPKEIIRRMSHYAVSIWIDLKCRQLRVAEWCDPNYGLVTLNHEIEIELPGTIQFRGGECIEISAVEGNKVFLADEPRHALGKGQSVNIHAARLEVKGFFTPEDLQWIEAAEACGVHQFMLSFYEGVEDLNRLKERLKKPEKAEVGLKIESLKGIEAIEAFSDPGLFGGRELSLGGITPHLVVARDDLLVSLQDNPIELIRVTKRCLEIDRSAVVASHLFSGIENTGRVTAADLSDLHLVHQMGFGNFMLSDGVSQHHFQEAMKVWDAYLKMKGEL